LQIAKERAEALWQRLIGLDQLDNVTALMALLRTETDGPH